jgi:hypothetical protein
MCLGNVIQTLLVKCEQRENKIAVGINGYAALFNREKIRVLEKTLEYMI